MAYPFNYNNNLYNNNRMFQPQMQPIYQPSYMQQPIQIAQGEQPFTEIRFLNKNEITGYVVIAGGKALLIDKENKYACVKSTDLSGNSRTEGEYSFVSLTDKTDSVAGEKQKDVDFSTFVTKEDFSKQFNPEMIKNLEEKISKLEKKIKINEIIAEEDKK